MKIQEKDLFHGAALTQIVEHRSFKALNKADEKYGHYQINHDRKLHVKHTKSTAAPWQFTFQQSDLTAIAKDIKSGAKTYICLICGDTTICTIDATEIGYVIDLTSSAPQWIRIEMPPKGSLWVRGSKGELKRSIPHNTFPEKVFS
jgi:hypothetical protein